MAFTIAVCIKQVPDTAEVRINPETNTLEREGVDAIINPFDTYALEEGVRIAEQHPESRVVVISMGPPQVEEALREAISLGAHEAILLSDPCFAGADTWSTSLVLSRALRQLAPDLVLVGKQAIDGDTAQIGPGVAAHNDWPQVCYVSELQDLDPEHVVVSRMLEEGHEVIEAELPCVLTVVKELNTPRMPTLSGRRRARMADISVWDHSRLGLLPEEIGLAGSPTQVSRIFSPPSRSGGVWVEGETGREKAVSLMTALRGRGILSAAEASV
ncbi:MAG: electron transfer flavoprotein subunit beta/FixA family protein [Planctomycetota bacterium]|jgi:electron transfer flavoprotein beta subunit